MGGAPIAFASWARALVADETSQSVVVQPDIAEGPVLRCQALDKSFGGLQALDSVSFAIRPREIVGLVGDNGAGKSTLIRVICGMHPPDRGEIWLLGHRYDQMTPGLAQQLGVHTVHQNLELCDNLGAAANVTLGREPVRLRIGPLRFIDTSVERHITQQRLAEVGITLPDYTQPVRRFSGGQRQAIAIARALDLGCRLLLLDEPTAALGPLQKTATLELIRRVRDQDSAPAIIVISHNLDDVFAVADHVLVMRLGRVVLDRHVTKTSHKEVVEALSGVALA